MWVGVVAARYTKIEGHEKNKRRKESMRLIGTRRKGFLELRRIEKGNIYANCI